MIFPVILSGGVGTRLWPLSRQSYPKQFAQLVGDETLFQRSTNRISGSINGLDVAAPIIITHSDFRFIVAEQLTQIGVDPGPIILEPEGRNTAAAVLVAALWVMRQDPDGVVLVSPSDHLIEDIPAFHAAIQTGLSALNHGRMVTFGITPHHPETGYGYLELATDPGDGNTPLALSKFVEKPDAARAAAMLKEKKFLWNAGIFLFRAADMVAAFEALAPEFVAPVTASLDQAWPDLGFLRLACDPWRSVPIQSIDYAIMEKADNLSVVPFDGGWSDLGGWDAVWREMPQTENGVACSSHATAIDCRDTLLRSEDDRLELVGIGLDGIVAVAMNDAVLVADRSRTQDVALAVKTLSASQTPQAASFPVEHRPWGFFERLVAGPRFQVKRIVVHPGEALSLQSHFHRSEHWVVVEGTARVTINDEVQLITENQSVYIPLGAVHRLENPGKVSMTLIEVQTGAYVGEDDVRRYEDAYARLNHAPKA